MQSSHCSLPPPPPPLPPPPLPPSPLDVSVELFQAFLEAWKQVGVVYMLDVVYYYYYYYYYYFR